MDLTFLNDYVVLVIVGICVCVGYVLKNSFPSLDNKYIPLIMAVIGVVLNVWIVKIISPDVILGGMFSDLASTGLHQLFVTLINKEDK
ncbi:phage holin family protein [Clostridium perfringens]|uniref:phage holin family protein n=1 Tax=Clostridium perfringens TaxID=1502 RepID=UPI0023305506|nr:phage holin family protein [Clostridium perfringens]MDB2050465.1 phage holin family protein [Clostridium perfringens]